MLTYRAKSDHVPNPNKSHKGVTMAMKRRSRWPKRHTLDQKPVPLIAYTPSFIPSNVSSPALYKSDIDYLNSFSDDQLKQLILALRTVRYPSMTMLMGRYFARPQSTSAKRQVYITPVTSEDQVRVPVASSTNSCLSSFRLASSMILLSLDVQDATPPFK